MKSRTQYFRIRRRAWLESGLTTQGRSRTNQEHPELAGLSEKEYHTQYMRKQRENDRKSWVNNQAKTQCQT